MSLMPASSGTHSNGPPDLEHAPVFECDGYKRKDEDSNTYTERKTREKTNKIGEKENDLR